MLALSSDFAGHSGRSDFELALRDLVQLHSWHAILWFQGARSMLSYFSANSLRAPYSVRRRMNLNDRAIARGIVCSAENLFALDRADSARIPRIDELWLEGSEFGLCPLFWSLLPGSKKILYPHSPDLQAEYDQCMRRNDRLRGQKKPWMLIKSMMGEALLGNPRSQHRITWDEIFTLNDSPEMGIPVIDCRAQLEANNLRHLAEHLPPARLNYLHELQCSADPDRTALLMLGNLGDKYLNAEVETYVELLKTACDRRRICNVLVKAHPRHSMQERDFFLTRLKERLPALSFETRSDMDSLPIEIILPYLPCTICIAGWTSAIRSVFILKKIPILVGVNRLKPLVYASPERREMFDEFLLQLPRYAELS